MVIIGQQEVEWKWTRISLETCHYAACIAVSFIGRIMKGDARVLFHPPKLNISEPKINFVAVVWHTK